MGKMNAPCCSKYCDIFSIISSDILKQYAIRFIAVRKTFPDKSFEQITKMHKSNSHSGFDLVMTTKNINDDDNDDVRITNYNDDIQYNNGSDNINKLFWSLWLYQCMDNIGDITLHELENIKKFIESNESSSFQVRIDPDTTTVVNIPNALSVVFDNRERGPGRREREQSRLDEGVGESEGGTRGIYKSVNSLSCIIFISIIIICSHILLIYRHYKSFKRIKHLHNI